MPKYIPGAESMVDDETKRAITFCQKLDREKLRLKIERVMAEIGRQQRIIHGGETARIAGSFHLGTVGGSGRQVRALNKRRGREVERVIDGAVRADRLKGILGSLKARMSMIDDGTAYKEAIQRAAKRQMKQTRTAVAQDNLKRVMDNMGSGDHTFRFCDGSEMCCWAGWSKRLSVPVAVVLLKANDGLLFTQKATSIQGVDIGKASVMLAKRYLDSRSGMVPAGIVI